MPNLLAGTCTWDFPGALDTSLYVERETAGSSGQARTEFDGVRRMMGITEGPSHQDGFGAQVIFDVDRHNNVTVLVLDGTKVIMVELNGGLPVGARATMARAIARLIVSRT